MASLRPAHPVRAQNALLNRVAGRDSNNRRAVWTTPERSLITSGTFSTIAIRARAATGTRAGPAPPFHGTLRAARSRDVF